MSLPFIRISAYKAWKDKKGNPRPGCKPYDTDFYTEMNRIKEGYYQPIVDKYRSIRDKEQKYIFKVTELPSLTISAICKDWRKKENVTAHTGLLNIDIDKSKNPHITNWGELRDNIFKLRGVVACFLSVSGEGISFVIKIHPEQHKDCFYSITDDLRSFYGIEADLGVHDVVRLRFVSYDPNTKIRYNFEEIPLCEPSASYLQGKRNYNIKETVIEPVGDADSEYNYLEAVKKAKTKSAFVDGSKWTFLICVAGCCNVMGMSLDFCKAQTLLHFGNKANVSADELLKPVIDTYKDYKHQHGTYDIQAASERLNFTLKRYLIHEWLHKGLKPNDEEIVEIGKKHEADIDRVKVVLERVFNEYKEEYNYDRFPAVQKVQIWLSKRFQFRFNSVTAQPEAMLQGSREIQNVNPDEIYRQLALHNLKFSLNNVKSLLRSDFVKPYDPILEYFQNLTYDGSKDYIDELAGYINVKDMEFWRKQFKKALVRSIACGLGLKENRIVMVLYGKKQETGKSTFIRFLSPWQDGKYFTESPIIGGNMKDTEIRFSENFIYNMEELAGLSRADVNKLKADISKSSIKERRSYAAFETSAPRRCNFWASTNQKEFLHDEENTRWLIFQVEKINWDYKKKIDINKVWAQAWHLYKDGFDYNLDADDRQKREHTNDEYRFRRPEEELIVRHFLPATNVNGSFYSSTEIAMELNNMNSSLHISPVNIGRTLSSLFGLEAMQVKIKGKNVRGYWLLKQRQDIDRELPVIVEQQQELISIDERPADWQNAFD